MFVHINCGSEPCFLFSTCGQILRSCLNVKFVVGGYGFEEFVASSHLWDGKVERIIMLIAGPMLLFAEHRKVSLKFVIRLMFEWPHKFGKDSYVKIQGKGTIKVKCTLVQALRLCTGRTAYRGSRCIPLLFHDHGTRRG